MDGSSYFRFLTVKQCIVATDNSLQGRKLAHHLGEQVHLGESGRPPRILLQGRIKQLGKMRGKSSYSLTLLGHGTECILEDNP